MKQYKSRVHIEYIVDQIEAEIRNEYGVGHDFCGECRPEEVENLMTHAQFAIDHYDYEETIEEIHEFYKEIAQGILDDDAEKDARLYQFRERRIYGSELRFRIKCAIIDCRTLPKRQRPQSFGVRFCPCRVRCGEALAPSYQWDIENDVSCYETTGEKLPGTSVVDITDVINSYETDEAARQIFDVVTTASYDGYPCIVYGAFAGYDQDEDEVLIHGAEVVKTLV